MGFSRQEYWSGLPFPTPGDLPDPEIEPAPSLMFPVLAGGYFTTGVIWDAPFLEVTFANVQTTAQSTASGAGGQSLNTGATS